MLLLCPLEHGQMILDMLKKFIWFKGRITLAVLEQNHSTLIEAAIRFLEPKKVVALDAEQIVSSSDALHLEPQVFISSTGLEYRHGGNFAAWDSSLGIEGVHGSSLLASASGTNSVIACHPRELNSVLQTIFTVFA